MHKGLPVAGYRDQPGDAVRRVNAHKEAEERILRLLDSYIDHPDIDQRWLAICRTIFEQAFMALNRAVFRPARVVLPEDA
jgi:hypothetical protein